MARGGSRPGSGRKKTRVATKEWKGPPLPESGSLTPLEFWKAVLRDPLAPYEIRAQAAKEAGPYMHARPAPKRDDEGQDLLPGSEWDTLLSPAVAGKKGLH